MILQVIRPGDNLWSLSTRYSVQTQDIITLNGLQSIPYLIIGQSLIIPSRETRYVVQPGDTLWAISRRFNVPISTIVSVNNIVNPNILAVGMVLRIPLSTSPIPTRTIEVLGYIIPTNTSVKHKNC